MSGFGGICWHCFWGWSQQVRDIYDRAEKDIDSIFDGDAPDVEPHYGEKALQFGPAHVVWSDENWDKNNIEWCLAECDSPAFRDWHPAAMEIVRRSLRELLALPADVRDPCPDNYDGDNPEKYPPSKELVMVK